MKCGVVLSHRRIPGMVLRSAESLEIYVMFTNATRHGALEFLEAALPHASSLFPASKLDLQQSRGRFVYSAGVISKFPTD
jgi:hypothetical protein